MLQAVQKLRQGMRCCRFHRTGPEPAVGVSLTQCPHLGKVDGWGGVGQGLSTCSLIIKCSFFGKGAVGEAEASAAERPVGLAAAQDWWSTPGPSLQVKRFLS